MADGSISALQADGIGAGTLVAGILLVILGFIMGAMGVLLFLQSLTATVRRGPPQATPDVVIDLDPDQWQRLPDPPLPNRSYGRG